LTTSPSQRVSLSPYYADDQVTLYLGDCREVIPRLLEQTSQVLADACIADPPYGQTALGWDRWPTGWPSVVAAALPATTSMWCFGSLRMFLDRARNFADWRLGEDVVWEKHNGSGASDAGRHFRVHESVVRFYRGVWSDVHSEITREDYAGPDKHTRRRAAATAHRRPDRETQYVDDGMRIPRSVRKYPSVRGRGRNETEKPLGLVAELVASIVPPGGVVLDPAAGSGTTGDAARQTGRRAVLIEMREQQCEIAARRFDAGVLA
jgi:site-specific DNA-methyltransferase (adenine-specific)